MYIDFLCFFTTSLIKRGLSFRAFFYGNFFGFFIYCYFLVSCILRMVFFFKSFYRLTPSGTRHFSVYSFLSGTYDRFAIHKTCIPILSFGFQLYFLYSLLNLRQLLLICSCRPSGIHIRTYSASVLWGLLIFFTFRLLFDLYCRQVIFRLHHFALLGKHRFYGLKTF